MFKVKFFQDLEGWLFAELGVEGVRALRDIAEVLMWFGLIVWGLVSLRGGR